MELILKICECFRIIDFPTAYIMIFSGAWLLVLIVAVAFVKPKNPDVYRILGFIPLLLMAEDGMPSVYSVAPEQHSGCCEEALQKMARTTR